MVTVLMANTEIEVQKLLGRTMKVSKKNELTITCKKAVCVVISKRDRPRHKLQSEDIKIKQVKKTNCEVL